MKRRTHQATRHAEWRSHVRSTGGAVLWLVGLLMIGAMYLAVNNKLARVGREVMTLESRRAELHRHSATLQAQLALSTSPQRMMEKALAMGFRPARLSEVEYIVVEGLTPKPPFVAPRPPARPHNRPTMLSPAFTETLGDWLARVLSGGGEG